MTDLPNPGMLVWVPHPAQGYAMARIVRLTADSATVELLNLPQVVAGAGAGGIGVDLKNQSNTSPNHNNHNLLRHTATYPLSAVLPLRRHSSAISALKAAAKAASAATSPPLDEADVEALGTDDNTQLPFLHEASLLDNLRRRFQHDVIFTWTGPILVSVNPQKTLPCFGVDTMSRFRDRRSKITTPHVYAIAARAYRDLEFNNQSQSILISGESGAGKTETSKFIIQYLTVPSVPSDHHSSDLANLTERILEANPILEMFGNAGTIRNHNSSRYGKFMDIRFDKHYHMHGAHISYYLLEKSRVCLQSKNECNYHIFYALCSQTLQHCYLYPEMQYKYLNGALPSVEFRDYTNLLASLKKIGLQATDIENIERGLAAILHLGNLDFAPNSADDGCHVINTLLGSGPCASESVLLVVANLLGCDMERLELAMCTRILSGTVKMGQIRKRLKVNEARAARDALAKALYANIFDHVVATINHSFPGDSGTHSSALGISILDIAGFEYFDINGYEQLLINYVNEKLQDYFNIKILREEQILYREEGIFFTPITFVSNKDCVAMFEEPKTGLLALLDEESKLPGANSARFAMSLHNHYRTHFYLLSPKNATLRHHQRLHDSEAFIVRHYAGAVCYRVDGFVEKNNDALHADLHHMMLESNHPFMRSLWNTGLQMKKPKKPDSVGSDSPTSSPSSHREHYSKITLETVGFKFQKQVQILLNRLHETKSHFIRCYKPNMSQEPNSFDGIDMLQQLRCTGMLETIKLMQSGFPSRVSLDLLEKRFGHLVANTEGTCSFKEIISALLLAAGLHESDFRIGIRHVFFRSGKYAAVDVLLEQDPSAIARKINVSLKSLRRARWRRIILGVLYLVRICKLSNQRAKARAILQRCGRKYLDRKRMNHKLKQIGRERKLRKMKSINAAATQSILDSYEAIPTSPQEPSEVIPLPTDSLKVITSNASSKLKSSERVIEKKRSEIDFTKKNWIQDIESERNEQKRRDFELAVRLARDISSTSIIQSLSSGSIRRSTSKSNKKTPISLTIDALAKIITDTDAIVAAGSSTSLSSTDQSETVSSNASSEFDASEPTKLSRIKSNGSKRMSSNFLNNREVISLSRTVSLKRAAAAFSNTQASSPSSPSPDFAHSMSASYNNEPKIRSSITSSANNHDADKIINENSNRKSDDEGEDDQELCIQVDPSITALAVQAMVQIPTDIDSTLGMEMAMMTSANIISASSDSPMEVTDRVENFIQTSLVDQDAIVDMPIYQLRELLHSDQQTNAKMAFTEMVRRVASFFKWKSYHVNESLSAAKVNGPLGALILQSGSANLQGSTGDVSMSSRTNLMTTNPYDRFFKISFNRPRIKSPTSKRGWLLLHFSNDMICRQIERFPTFLPTLLQIDEPDRVDEMCPLTLQESGLSDCPDLEISRAEFERTWRLCQDQIDRYHFQNMDGQPRARAMT